jgi:Transposase IS200 like
VGKNFWADRYFAETSGQVYGKQIREYIQKSIALSREIKSRGLKAPVLYSQYHF